MKKVLTPYQRGMNLLHFALLCTFFNVGFVLCSYAQKTVRSQFEEMKHLSSEIESTRQEIRSMIPTLNNMLACAAAGGFYNVEIDACRSERDVNTTDAFHLLGANGQPVCPGNQSPMYIAGGAAWTCRADMVGHIIRRFRHADNPDLVYVTVDQVDDSGLMVNADGNLNENVLNFDIADDRYANPEVEIKVNAVKIPPNITSAYDASGGNCGGGCARSYDPDRNSWSRDCTGGGDGNNGAGSYGSFGEMADAIGRGFGFGGGDRGSGWD